MISDHNLTGGLHLDRQLPLAAVTGVPGYRMALPAALLFPSQPADVHRQTLCQALEFVLIFRRFPVEDQPSVRPEFEAKVLFTN